VTSLNDPPCGKSEIYLLPRHGINSNAFFNGIDKLGIEVCYKKKEIHKLIYHLMFSFRNIPSMTILLGI